MSKLNATTGLNDVIEGSQFGWPQMYNYTVNRTAFLTYDQVNDDPEQAWFLSPPPGAAFNFLFVNLAVYFIWAWYLSQIITGGESRPQPLYFPFYWRYWFTVNDNGASLRKVQALLRRTSESVREGLDSDVQEEMQAVHEGTTPKNTTVTLLGLTKSFRKFTAVKGVSYSMQKGELFALLGHNGAGKTTTIKMVTAQLRPTSGETMVHGLSVNEEAHKIRKFLGMCPQHDILYNELTASEHLWLYGRLKGLPTAMLEEQVPALVKGVKLDRVAHKQAGTYSGGMKRRLSVAISFIGNPKVVMLDEPTTGMDPMNRKHVWDMIAELKLERTVLLTTHSMEEADALGDRIGIMSAGQLVALGNSLHLKEKFGDGYTIKVVAPMESAVLLQQKFAEVLPEARLTDSNAGNMTYVLPDAETIAKAPKLISLIESVQAGEVAGLSLTDWGISHTTLEDVFLKLAKEGHAAYTELFKLRLELHRDGYTPGEECAYVGTDGLEYVIPAEKMPTADKWQELTKESELVDWTVKVPKQMMDITVKKKLFGARLILLHKSKPDARTGLGLGGEGDEPVVQAVHEEGLAYGQVKEGDTILAINGKLVEGHEKATETLKAAVGNVALHIRPVLSAQDEAEALRKAGKKPRRYHLAALRGRSFPNMLRQAFYYLPVPYACIPCVVCALFFPVMFMLFLILFDASVTSTGVLRNRAIIETVITASKVGCSNSSDILQKMCETKSNTAKNAHYDGCEWCPKELGSICSFVARFRGDQCASTYGVTGGGRANPAFADNCTAGPTMRYQYDNLLPKFCDCTSPEFEQLKKGTVFCELDQRFNSLFLQDPQSMTVMRNFNTSRDGYKVDFGFRSFFRPDNWANFVSWRIPVIAPSSLNVGALSGYLADNGWLGSWNETYDASQATRTAVEATSAVTGLLRHFPKGIAYTDPGAMPASARFQPATYTSTFWKQKKSCYADPSFTTCCFSTTRTVDNPYPSCPRSSIGCEDEDKLPLEQVQCAECSKYESNPFKADSLWLVQRQYSQGSGRSQQRNVRNVTYTFDPTSLVSYCHGRQCEASRCAINANGHWKNPKCNNVVPAMQAQCANYTGEIVKACQKGEQWYHPADPKLLMFKWATWRGSAVFAPGADVSVSPSLKAAFDYADALVKAKAPTSLKPAAKFVPNTHCIPPFCYDFRAAAPAAAITTAASLSTPFSEQLYDLSAGGHCDASFDNFSAWLEPLNHMYPCNAHKADLYTEDGSLYNTSASYSTAEAQLCKEAYGIMSTVYTQGSGFGDFTKVPACDPKDAVTGLDMHDAFHTSCGTCSLTLCPVHDHFTTPLYYDAPSLVSVAGDVLRNEQAVLCKEQSLDPSTCDALPGPTEPLASIPSLELEKLFPSTAIAFEALDLSALKVKFEIASYWGTSDAWPFLVAPPEWELPVEQQSGSGYKDDFTLVKFPKGGNSWINDRLIYSGGFASMMTNWVTNAVLKAGLDPSLEVTTAMKPFPYVITFEGIGNEQAAANDVLAMWSLLVDVFVPFGCSVLTFYFLTLQVVTEKEHRLRALMVMMGLDMRYYWLWEWMINTLITLVAFFCFWVVGLSYGIKFIIRSPVTSILLLVLWSQSLVTLAMLASCFFSRQLWASIGCFLLMLMTVLFSFLMNQFVLFRSTDEWPQVLFLFSPLAFFRGINLLNKRTYAIDYLEGEMPTVLTFLAIDTVLYFLLAQYLDIVLPSEFGVVRHPLFFLAPIKRLFVAEKPPEGAPPDPDEDEDVATERRAVEEMIKKRTLGGGDGSSSSSTSSTNPGRGEGDALPIECLSLRKVYAGGKVAVRNQTFSVRHDECFGLLGPNGAGKTTTISMLTGLYPPTSGNAHIYGFDIRTQMAKIYEMMGVCPQFDILWPLLTVVETLRFYCKLKAVPSGQWHQTAVDAAFSVDLGHARNRRVGRLSGGMKRRVSLAISLVGNPKVVFLDEPTTGLDPETKRAMWTLVDIAKEGRAIVLTTHSMEEADALCGRIAIMAYGKMRCLGTSLHLKDKFGEGYKIVVSYQEGASKTTTAFIASKIPEARLIGDFNGTATFMIPTGSVALSAVFDIMKERPDGTGIVDWALRQTSMEEVFLRIAHASEVQNAREQDELITDAKRKGSPKMIAPHGSPATRSVAMSSAYSTTSSSVDNVEAVAA